MSSLNFHSKPSPAGLVTVQYDGSADGCLCALAQVLAQGISSPITFSSNDSTTNDLFVAQANHVETNAAIADQFYQQLQEKGGKQAARNVLFALLVMENGTESALLGYVQKLLQHGAAVDQLHNNADIAFIHRSARKVGHEIHRLKGLLRFEKLLDGRFLAVYEPDYDITLFLAWHFARRLRAQNWIIFDARRRCAATWNGRQLNAEALDRGVLTGAALQKLLLTCQPDPADAVVQQHWKTFHRSVAIENRINPVLQRRCMPARYWGHLTEMQASAS